MKKDNVLFKTYLIYFIVLVAFVLLRIASRLGAFSFITDAFTRSNVATIVIQVIIMFLLPLMLLKLIKKNSVKQTFEKIKFKKISGKSVLILIAIGFVAFFLNIAVSTFFNGIISIFGYSTPVSSGGGESYTYDTILNFVRGIVFVAVLPALFEEFVHRGFLMRGAAKKIGVRRALIISSVLFGLMHLNIEQFFYASILGLLIGLVAIMCESIIPSIIIHFMNNFLNVYLIFAANNDLPGGEFYNSLNSFFSSTPAPIAFVFCLVALSVLVFLLYMLLIALLKENKIKKLNGLLTTIKTAMINEETQEVNYEVMTSEQVGAMMPDDIKSAKNELDLFLPRSEADNYKPSFKENLFLYASLILGTMITLFTFIWGLV